MQAFHRRLHHPRCGNRMTPHGAMVAETNNVNFPSSYHCGSRKAGCPRLDAITHVSLRLAEVWPHDLGMLADLQFSKPRRADHQCPYILHIGSDLLMPALGSLATSSLVSLTDCGPLPTICRCALFAQRQLPQCCSSKPNTPLLTLCQPRGGQGPSATAVVVFLSSKFQIKHGKIMSDKHGPAKISSPPCPPGSCPVHRRDSSPGLARRG